MIDDIEDEERYEEAINYEPLQAVYPNDGEHELRGPTGTQIVLYEEKKYVKPDVVFETPETKMPTHDRGEESYMNERDRSSDIPPNELSEFDESWKNEEQKLCRKKMFPDEDFVEQSTFHERKSTNETEKRFQKGEYSILYPKHGKNWSFLSFPYPPPNRPLGIVEDILVQVKRKFLVDFYVLKK
ncbi:Cell division protein ftsH [Cucumis melo var. makuwa]|uniref:Cell division protein ftsH n=1 Tax=Cucumis melo var. makuwa TaxID=1194695 RepID=A0A5A7SWP5_CUCMM|nr:Cell division protein ftsH [Cucumis melo var. makuwa]